MKVLGRVFISIIFILFGVSSAINWDISYTDLDAAIVSLQMYSANFQIVGAFFDKIINYISLILAIGIFFQIVGGLLLFFGIYQKLAATFLSSYIICATIIYYPFWFYEGEQFNSCLILFLKNLAILGGIFLLFGRGKISSSSYEIIDKD